MVTKKNTSLEGHRSKIFLFMLFSIMLFSVSFASAYEFDNVKSYDVATKTATIENAYGLPNFLGGYEIADIPLISKQNEVVGLGYQKIFQYELNGYTNYKDFIQEIEVTNLKTGKVELKEIDLKYLEYIEVDVYDEKPVCSAGKNGTDVCVYGTHKEQRENWKDLTSKDIIQGEKKIISGWVNVNQGDYYEWIPKFAGVTVPEWATWSGNLSTSLTDYWKFDESSGNAVNSINTSNNGVPSSASFVAGKLGNAIETNPVTEYVDMGYPSNVNTVATINFWIKPNINVAGFLMTKDYSGTNAGDFNFQMTNTGLMKMENRLGSVVFTSNTSFTNMTWQMVTVTWDGTDTRMYINGVITGKGSNTEGILGSAGGKFLLNRFGAGADGIIASYDEFGIWLGRALTYTEIVLLYNSGTGCAYGNEYCYSLPDASPTITLNTPSDLAIVRTQAVVPNCTGVDDIKVQNVSLIINNSYNQTNTSAFNNTLTGFTVNLADGYYSWKCEVCDNATAPQCVNATARTFYVNTTPVVYTFSPENITYTTPIVYFNATSDLGIDQWIVNYNGTNKTLASINSTVSVEDGTFNLLFYARNSVSGRYGLNASRNFSVNTIPLINITDPTANNSNYTRNAIYINATHTLGIDQWLLNYNGTNYTLTNVSTLFNFLDGTHHRILLYGRNTASGKYGLNDSMYINVNTIPAINVTDPIANNSNYTINTIFINATYTQAIDDWKFNINGSNYTLTNINTSIQVTDGSYRLLLYGRNTISGLYGLNNSIYFNVDTKPKINITDPTANNSNYTISTIFFNATYTLGVDQWILNYNGTNVTLTGINTSLNVEDGKFRIYLYGRNAVSGLYGLNNSIYFNVDANHPQFTLVSLDNVATQVLPVNATFNVTTIDGNPDDCWYFTSDNATNISYICNTTNYPNFTVGGDKNITVWANDTFGNYNFTMYSFKIYSFIPTLVGDNATAEGVSERFILYVNTSPYLVEDEVWSANLWYNGTKIGLNSTTILDPDRIKFVTDYIIPDGMGNTTGINRTWFFEYNATHFPLQNTSNQTQTVYAVDVGDCATTGYARVILNLSLRDEETVEWFNVTDPSTSTVGLDIEVISIADPSVSWNFYTTWNNNNSMAVCMPDGILNSSSYTVDFIVGYEGTDHVKEFYYLENGYLNDTLLFNSYTNSSINLMDLKTADSTSFLFNYYDADGSPVEDTIVHVFRKYVGEGIFREVERAKVDENGDTIVHLVEEDVIYYFMITQNGSIIFTSSTYTALCQTTPCVLTISASGGSIPFGTDWDLITGGGYTLSSNSATRYMNLTYSLEETGTMNLTIYKYDDDGSYSPINSTTSTGTSGTLLLYVPQSAGNVTFFATVRKDGDFVRSVWVDFEGKASDRFGVTLAVLLGALIVLTLGLMAVTEGGATIFMVILGVALSGFLGLFVIDAGGVPIVVYLILVGAILLYKLTGSRR